MKAATTSSQNGVVVRRVRGEGRLDDGVLGVEAGKAA